MPQEIWLATTRTGQLIEKIPYQGESGAGKDLRSSSTASVEIPLMELSAAIRANPENYFRKNFRSIVFIDPDDVVQKIHGAFVIEDFTVDTTNSTISLQCVEFGRWVRRIPIVPVASRDAILSDEAVWTLTGTPQSVINQVLSAVLTEDAKRAAPRNLILPTGGSGSITQNFSLSELITFEDLINDLADSYEGFEVLFVPRFATGSTTSFVYDVAVGNPHFRKSDPVLQLDIEEAGAGTVRFAYTNNGQDDSNWFFLQSGAYSERDPKAIDLKSFTSSTKPADPEFLSLFSKERFDAILTPAELNAQGAARVSASEIDVKTFVIEIFDSSFKWIHYLGRALTVTGAKKIPSLNEKLRITAIEWKINDPSSIRLTVQPFNLRRYPKVPTRGRITDIIDRAAQKQANADKWKTPVTGIPSWGGGGGNGLPDDWETPGVPQVDTPGGERSPFIKCKLLNTDEAVFPTTTGITRFSTGVWGNSFGSTKRLGNGPEGTSIIPEHGRKVFYGLNWNNLVLKYNNSMTRKRPVAVVVYKSRVFASYPTHSGVASTTNPRTDANFGLSGTGGVLSQTIPVETIESQMLPEMMMNPMGYSLRYENLRTGNFIRGIGTNQKYVIYFHQLQIWTASNTHIRSKGFAFEISINADGSFSGSWASTPYPFDVPGDQFSYFPDVNQTDVAGPNKEYVTCVTPYGYFKDKTVLVPFPTIVTPEYWRDIQQGKFAVKNITITYQYLTGDVIKKKGPAPDLFQPISGTGNGTWIESYQFLVYGNEMWTVNRTYESYNAQYSNSEGRRMAMRFFLKSTIDSDGSPTEWTTIAYVYGFINNPGRYTDIVYNLKAAELIGWKDKVWGGRAYDQLDVEGGAHTITGKVGSKAGRILYVEPQEDGGYDSNQQPHSDAHSTYFATGLTGVGASKPFYGDFYDFSVSPANTPGVNSNDFYYEYTSYIIPRYNGRSSDVPWDATGGTGRSLSVGAYTVSPGASYSPLYYAIGVYPAFIGYNRPWIWRG